MHRPAVIKTPPHRKPLKLEEVQPWIQSLVKARSSVANVPIILDDGTYPKTPGREHALGTGGLCLIVWQIESDGLIDETAKGACIETLFLAVVIEENVKVCRSETGLKIPAEKALRLVREALVGKRPADEPGTVLRCANPPFKNFGNKNGVQRIVALFSLDLQIVPV